MRNRGPWLPLALLAVGVAALTLVVIALASDDGERDERAGDADTSTVVVVTESGPESTTAAEEPTSAVVPNVTGLDYAAAGERAEAAGLVPDYYPVESGAPAGRVVSQEPGPGAAVATTRHLRLDVSVGPDERAVLRVPDVTGPKAPRARQIAWEQGFLTLTADRDAPTAEEVDEVILQQPAAGTEARALTQITLYVGR